MAHIEFVPPDEIDPADRVNDDDHIIQVHSIHSRVMKLHYELYLELMHKSGPLSKYQKELIAVSVSAANSCHY